MPGRFQDQVIVVVGATGGLGTAFARAFAAEGARLILAGRQAEALQVLALELGPAARFFALDLSRPDQATALRDFVMSAYGRVDAVVNAAGVDIRKALEAHSAEDIQRTLDVNLRGAISLTQAFLTPMRQQNQGVMAHVGGFADGRLAFPYYSVDAASRAGVATFAEAVNRELKTEGSRVVVTFFSPSPADTAAERPFHPLWRELGVPVEPVEHVAAALLKAVEQRRPVYLMGGFSTALFARLNAAFPRLADRLLLDRYSRSLNRFLAIPAAPAPAPSKPKPVWPRWIGVGLIVLSFGLYGALLGVPFLPVSAAAKVALTPALIGLGEASFWIGGALLGKELVDRYKRCLNPRRWFKAG